MTRRDVSGWRFRPQRAQTRSARRELAEILGTPLREGVEENNRILFAQAEPLSGPPPPWPGPPDMGEPVSGDTGIWFRREDGMLFLLLCDGMGSGPGAKQESAQAAKLIERFLRAGMDRRKRWRPSVPPVPPGRGGGQHHH